MKNLIDNKISIIRDEIREKMRHRINHFTTLEDKVRQDNFNNKYYVNSFMGDKASFKAIYMNKNNERYNHANNNNYNKYTNFNVKEKVGIEDE